jgi:hypothetical protein
VEYFVELKLWQTSTRLKRNEMTTKPLQALVFGASGITGWAIANSALCYPTARTFPRVIGLTSRPLSIEDAGMPFDPRLELYAGLDLSQNLSSIVSYLSGIEKIEEITHVYFAGKNLKMEGGYCDG